MLILGRVSRRCQILQSHHVGRSACEVQDVSAAKDPCQGPKQTRRREYLVGSFQPADMADRRMLRSENSASAQNKESSRDRCGNPGIRALRRFHSLGTTQTASEALVITSKTSSSIVEGIPGKLSLTLRRC